MLDLTDLVIQTFLGVRVARDTLLLHGEALLFIVQALAPDRFVADATHLHLRNQ